MDYTIEEMRKYTGDVGGQVSHWRSEIQIWNGERLGSWISIGYIRVNS